MVPLNERPEYFFNELAISLENIESLSPALKATRFDLEIAKANQVVAKSDQGIRVGINISGQSIHEDRPSEDFYHRYRLLNQAFIKKPLFHWGALKAREEIAKLRKNWAYQSLEYKRRLLEGELRAAFLELVVINYRIQLATEQLKLAVQNVNSAKEKLKVGLGTSLALEEAKTEELNKEISLSESLISLARKKTIFDSLSGNSSPMNFNIPENFLEFCLTYQPNSDFPVLLGSINSKEITDLQLQLSIEDQEILIANAELKPKLNLTGLYYQDQIDVVESGRNLDRNNFLIGIEANWAIWDSHKSEAQKNAALARKAKIQHAIKTKSQEYRESINSMVSELNSIKERIDLGRKLISVAESRLEKSEAELELNRISPKEHFPAIVDLDFAKLNNLEFVCKYMVLIDQYEMAVGFENLGKSPEKNE